jgi:hypothetical protein
MVQLVYDQELLFEESLSACARVEAEAHAESETIRRLPPLVWLPVDVAVGFTAAADNVARSEEEEQEGKELEGEEQEGEEQEGEEQEEEEQEEEEQEGEEQKGEGQEEEENEELEEEEEDLDNPPRP